MEKVASNVKVVVRDYFGRQRPFIVGDEVADKPVVAKKPIFDGKSMFVEGHEFRAGVYYGDVYHEPHRDTYLLRIVTEPYKALHLIPPAGVYHPIRIVIKSSETDPICTISMLPLVFTDEDKGTIEDNIKVLQRSVNEILKRMVNLEDLATPDVEMCVRAYHLYKKLASMDIKGK